MASSKKNKESATVLDTLARMDKDSTPKRSSKGSSRKSEGKTEKPEKSEKPAKSEKPKNLRTSLTDMLVLDDDDSDDDPGFDAKDCMTVSTMDSIERQKDKSGSSTKRSSKRGTKKPAPSLGSTLGTLGGKQRDFGRHADDNDTFCGEAEPKSKSAPKNTKPAPLMKAKPKTMASPFMMPSNDDSDSDEEDLFEDFSGASNNPFRKP
jgi:hypothetical protein